MTEKASCKDPAVTISAADRLLAVTANPLHRQILENYRRHAILEVTGNWADIFAPDMTVPEPVYTFDVTSFEGVKLTGDEVKGFYKALADQQAGLRPGRLLRDAAAPGDDVAVRSGLRLTRRCYQARSTKMVVTVWNHGRSPYAWLW